MNNFFWMIIAHLNKKMKKILCSLGIHKFNFSEKMFSVGGNSSFSGKKKCPSKKCVKCGIEKVLWGGMWYDLNKEVKLKEPKDNMKFWESRQIDWKKAYFNLDHPHRKVLIDFLKTCKISSVLEIGCACGANLYNIKKEFPNIKIAGCDIAEDAIKTADEIFRAEYPEEKFLPSTSDGNAEIDFRVGGIEAIPFHGMAFDMIITDACLIYINKKHIQRAMREIRRVAAGGGQVLFIEFHSKSWLKRVGLRVISKFRYTSYDYNKLLNKYFFKGIRIFSLSKEIWPGHLWGEFGYLMMAYV